MISLRSPNIRKACEDDVPHILRLNKNAESITSVMSEAHYRDIAQQAFINIVAELDGRVAGFLLGFRDGARYENENFEWFSKRCEDFAYIDRVIVDETHQRCGVGQCLYSHIANTAIELQLRYLVCEIDLDPPNSGSLRFHEGLGFKEVGTRRLASGKTVSMRIKSL